MVAVPGATAVTTPVDVTVATDASLVDQRTTRPTRGLPDASSGCASSCAACPTTSDCEDGFTWTEATGTADTVTDAGALLPSAEAVMSAPPGESAVTRPLALTVAIPGLLLDQVIGRSARALPAPSRASAVNWKLSSTYSDRLAGETCTVATGVAVTVTSAKPLRPPALAATCTVPSFRAWTTPSAVIVAISRFSLDQCTGRSINMVPEGSSTCAVRPRLAPTATVEVGGEMTIDCTAWPTGSSRSPPHDDTNAITTAGRRRRTRDDQATAGWARDQAMDIAPTIPRRPRVATGFASQAGGRVRWSVMTASGVVRR